MRRLLLSVVLAGLFSSFGFYWAWSHAGLLPGSWEWVMAVPFLPGHGLAVLADQLGMLTEDRNYAKSSALMFAGDTIFWAAVFYGLATLYVRRKERRGGAEPPPLKGPSAGGS